MENKLLPPLLVYTVRAHFFPCQHASLLSWACSRGRRPEEMAAEAGWKRWCHGRRRFRAPAGAHGRGSPWEPGARDSSISSFRAPPCPGLRRRRGAAARSCGGGSAMARLGEGVGSGGSEDAEQERCSPVSEARVSRHLSSRSGEIAMLSLSNYKVLKQSPPENNLLVAL